MWNLNETIGFHLGRLDGHVRHAVLSALVFLLKDWVFYLHNLH